MRRLSLIVPVLLVAAFALMPAPARAQFDSLPYVTSITTLPEHPCDSIPTRIVIAGQFPTQCGAVLGNDGYTVYVSDPNPPCAGCLEGPKPWADTLEVGLLRAGEYQFRVGIGIVGICSNPPDTTRYTTRFGVSVGFGCPPPGMFDPMTYVDRVLITSKRDPGSTLICEGDSILLRVSGTFPDNCHILRSIELLPYVGVSPGAVVPIPPTVRLVFDNQCCQDQVCTPFPVPWESHLVLPPMGPGTRSIALVGYETCCRDIPEPTDPWGKRRFDFAVTSAESCAAMPPPFTCLYPSWLHDQTRCDAFLSKTSGPAVVTGTVRTSVPLAGIQGEVHSYPDSAGASLFVTSIEPTGPATGMHLTWEPIPGGAKFVLWADQGAPIPVDDLGHRPSQFLKISWALGARNTRDNGIVPPDTRWFISWSQVFGSDIDGKLVPLCPIATLVVDAATICYGEPAHCDLNGDFHSDVRDLVLMSHCLVSPRACPWDMTSLDCDGDNDFDFDDLFCCARNVIGIPPCDSCQDSVRVESGIALKFGTPQRTADGIDIPVRIDGATLIGAGRFQFTLPGALASNASFEANSSMWLPVSRNTGDGLEVGLIQLPPNPNDRHPDWLEAVVHLPLPAGTQASGEVRLTEVQLSGQDGVMLKADLGSPVVRLGPGLGVSLSQARPNPFASSTTFRLTLDAAAGAADIGVYDLSGRRVAILHQGALPIGSHPFTWDGRIDGGGRAKSGVYFVRALVDGHTTNQKLVMLKQ